MQRQRVNGLVFEMPRLLTPRPVRLEPLEPQPIRKPSHVTVAHEWVGNQVERLHVVERVKGAGRDAADLVRVQVELLKVVQPAKDLVVHILESVLSQVPKIGEKNNWLKLVSMRLINKLLTA